MKNITGLFFAAALIFSAAFIADSSSVQAQNRPSAIASQETSKTKMSAQTQTRTGQVTVKRKRTGGVIGATGRGVRYVYRNGKRVAIYTGKKTYQGGKYVGKKTYQGGKYVGGKTVDGTKYVGGKTIDGAKYAGGKTVDGTKYVGGKAVGGTKYVGRKTVGGVKKVGSATKKIFTGN